jgi:hypothetical protein
MNETIKNGLQILDQIIKELLDCKVENNEMTFNKNFDVETIKAKMINAFNHGHLIL